MITQINKNVCRVRHCRKGGRRSKFLSLLHWPVNAFLEFFVLLLSKEQLIGLDSSSLTSGMQLGGLGSLSFVSASILIRMSRRSFSGFGSGGAGLSLPEFQQAHFNPLSSSRTEPASVRLEEGCGCLRFLLGEGLPPSRPQAALGVPGGLRSVGH